MGCFDVLRIACPLIGLYIGAGEGHHRYGLTGAIVGGIAGIIVGLLAAVALMFIFVGFFWVIGKIDRWWMWRRKRYNSEPEGPTWPPPPTGPSPPAA